MQFCEIQGLQIGYRELRKSVIADDGELIDGEEILYSNYEQSEQYFHSRPKLSQIGALASPQSQEIAGRDELEAKMSQLEGEYADKEVPKPSYWGGYILKPRLIEFWQGRRSRLHDRIVFKKIDNKTWKKVRLAP